MVAGLSFRTAPVEVREALAVPEAEMHDALARLRLRGLSEVALVSTCNRVEIYGQAPSEDLGLAAIHAFMTERAPGAVPGNAEHFKRSSHFYLKRHIAAVHHTFRVAASLDSMVVGEPQILGQLKQAYLAAESAATLGSTLERCMSQAFAVAKRVRRETAIAAGAVSISSIACELARKIFGQLDGKRVMLLGAGKMGEAAARKLARMGARLTVVNRSLERAEHLAKACGGTLRPFEDLGDALIDADVVICSTGSPYFVITQEMMKQVTKARRRRPLFIIDIAVPRNVDPRVGGLGNVFLYDVDDLDVVAKANLDARQREADAAERIVQEEVSRFMRWLESLALTPTIVALRQAVQGSLRAELERTLPRLGDLSEADRKALDKMCDAMTNKVLHAPLTALKSQAAEGQGTALLEAVQALFELDRASESMRPKREVSLPPTRTGRQDRQAQQEPNTRPRVTAPSNESSLELGPSPQRPGTPGTVVQGSPTQGESS